MPKPLSDLFEGANLTLLYPDLLKKCKDVFETYTITTDMAKQIEKHTHEQTLSKVWFQQRAGRVTASRLKSAVCTESTFFMDEIYWKFSQSVYHTYCYQVQTQLKFCNA